MQPRAVSALSDLEEMKQWGFVRPTRVPRKVKLKGVYIPDAASRTRCERRSLKANWKGTRQGKP